MALRFLQRATLLASLLSLAQSQTRDTIPPDLSTGFTNKEIQVAFSANAVNGFAPGTTFPASAVADEPTFALGDSNGISPSTLYTLIMLDTTCPSARTLHYARSNFRFAFAGGTNIETESAPALPYKAPGAFGEAGDARQYVFLMYTNPQRRELGELQMPDQGAVFDVQRFQSDNGLKDPVAGVDMVVQLGGEAACEGGSAVPTSAVPTSAVPTSAGGSSSAASLSAAATSAGTVEQSAAGSSTAAISSVASASAAPSAITVRPSTIDTSSAGETPTATNTPTAIATPTANTPTPAPPSAPQTAVPTPPPSSEQASGTAAATASGALLEQTENAAARGVGACGVFVAQVLVLVVGGGLAW